jgi:hypothetical protein
MKTRLACSSTFQFSVYRILPRILAAQVIAFKLINQVIGEQYVANLKSLSGDGDGFIPPTTNEVLYRRVSWYNFMGFAKVRPDIEPQHGKPGQPQTTLNLPECAEQLAHKRLYGFATRIRLSIKSSC